MALSKNPNYLLAITQQDTGISIRANLPENFVISTGSQWESRMANLSSVKNLIENNAPGATKLLASGALFATNFDPIIQSLTFQSWQSSAPIEFNMSIQFDAQTDPKEDIIKPMAMLQAMSLPYITGDGSAGILLPPGPSPAFPNRARISVRLGRMMYIHSVVLKSVTNSVDTRFDKNGQPISGQSEITFATINTPSSQDVTTFYSAIAGENTAYGTRSGLIPGVAR